MPFKTRQSIDTKLKKLAENPWRDDLDIKKLKGHDLHRLRVGEYRIIYQMKAKELIVLVLTVGHRKEIYRI